ncbi:MAG TPA: hypothetical protein VFZ65_21800 [Planctomycetota bacterium]|nr:hypothetical protein [Planctomycetota bacterium]
MLRLLSATAFLFLPGFACCVGQTAPTGGAADAHQIHWQRSLDDALALAAATSRPLLIAVNMDGESASDRIVHEQYRDPAFVALTRRCVCLGASVFRHNARDHDDQGRRIPCPRFGDITCGEHIALEPVLFDKYLADGERVAPRHALVRPDGTKAFDLSLCFDLEDVDRALATAVAGSDGGSRVAAGAADWDSLAARRDAAGRSLLEAALQRATDDASLQQALAAIAAHGDAGSLEALRLVAAREPALGWAAGQLTATVRALGLGTAWFTVWQDVEQALGCLPDDPGPDARQREWLFSPPLRDDLPASQRSFLLARGAVDDPVIVQAIAGGSPLDPPRVEPVQLGSLLQTANAVARRETDLPHTGGPTDAMPEQAELEHRLEQLDAAAAERRDDADWQEQFAKASLDLGRRRIEAGRRDADLLLEDAARYFERATAKEPAHCEWWIERARTAYFRQHFDEQVEFGMRAFAVAAGSDRVPLETELLGSPVLNDANAIEALRWVGDGHARLLASRAGKDMTAELAGMIDGLRALAIVAASPFGAEGDWVTLASYCGALGLLREQVALAECGAMRYPASRDLRQALNGALWQAGRPELMPAVAGAIERAHAPSADAAWFTGYAFLLAAEDDRRAGRPLPARDAYASAHACFARAAAANPAYADNCAWFRAMTWLGRAMIEAMSAQRAPAVDALVEAIRLHGDLSQYRDGLGYDALDVVDRILEWRPGPPPEIAPLQLLDRLDGVAGGDPYWAVAVSDSALREALRADGRNPERIDRETVDAAGNKITMPMGLPTADGDTWLLASIEAGRRAAARAKTDADKQPLAQSDTIWAERALQRGTLDGVRAALAEAAPLLGLEPPADGAGEAALRALAAELRQHLGEARPHFREGR